MTDSAAGEQLRVHAICRSLEIDDATVVDEGAALTRLRAQPELVLIDVDHPQARSLIARIRCDRLLFGLPVLVLTRELTAKGLARPLGWGADAALPIESLTRLDALVAAGRGQASDATSGGVTLCFAAASQRVLRAGVLRGAGIRSRFCASLDELRWCIDDPGGELFVAETSMLGSPTVLSELRALDPCQRPWALVVPDAEAEAWRVVPLEGIALVPEEAPLTDVLHRALAARAHAHQEVRATPRLYHASLVRYAHHGDVAYGLSFNVARDGLYVRAAAPPPRGAELSLEVTPPGSLATVRLEGVVAWSKPFGSRAFASSPPGFGVAIAGGDEGQLLRWRRGYERLRAAG